MFQLFTALSTGETMKEAFVQLALLRFDHEQDRFAFSELEVSSRVSLLFDFKPEPI